MEALIVERAAMSYFVVAIFGAVMHWSKKALRGEITSNPVDYWLADHPGRSGFTLGALVVSAWAVGATDILAGASAWAIVSMAFAAGWAIDSGVNKGAVLIPGGNIEPRHSRDYGFVRLSVLPILMAGAIVAGCASVYNEIPSTKHCDEVSYIRNGRDVQISAHCIAPAGEPGVISDLVD